MAFSSRRLRRRATVAIVVCAAVVAVGACRRAAAPDVELVAAVRTEPPGFNPYVGRSTNVTEVISRLIHAPLARINRITGEVEPWLAERWSVSADGLTWTVTLRPNLRFSDGAPLTADDVAFAFRAIEDPGSASAIRDSLLIGGRPITVSAVDARTLLVTFPARFGPGMQVFDNLPILPRHKLQAALDAGRLREAWNSGTPPKEIAGAGPFRLASYTPGERLVFERNPYYFHGGSSSLSNASASDRLSDVNRLVLLVVRDPNAEMLRLSSGQIDIIAREIRPEDIASVRRQAGQGRLAIADAGVSLDPNMLWFNLAPGAYSGDPRKPWLQSEEFRKAISHAIDRRAIVDQVYLGEAEPAFGPVTRGNTRWFVPDLPRYDYDPARATSILTRALRFSDRNGDGMLEDAAGRPVRFSILTQQQDTVRMRTAVVLQEQLRKVGVGVDVVGLDAGGLIERFTSGSYDAIYFGVEATSTDPANNLDFWLSSGGFHVWNPSQKSPATEWERAIDSLMQRQVATSDPSERMRLFADVQRIFAERCPVIYLAAPRMLVAMSTKVRGATPAPLSPHVLWNPDALTVAPSRP